MLNKYIVLYCIVFSDSRLCIVSGILVVPYTNYVIHLIKDNGQFFLLQSVQKKMLCLAKSKVL